MINRYDQRLNKCNQLFERETEQMEKMKETWMKIVKLAHHYKISMRKKVPIERTYDEECKKIQNEIERLDKDMVCFQKSNIVLISDLERKEKLLHKKLKNNNNELIERTNIINNQIIALNKLMNKAKPLIDPKVKTDDIKNIVLIEHISALKIQKYWRKYRKLKKIDNSLQKISLNQPKKEIADLNTIIGNKNFNNDEKLNNTIKNCHKVTNDNPKSEMKNEIHKGIDISTNVVNLELNEKNIKNTEPDENLEKPKIKTIKNSDINSNEKDIMKTFHFNDNIIVENTKQKEQHYEDTNKSKKLFNFNKIEDKNKSPEEMIEIDEEELIIDKNSLSDIFNCDKIIKKESENENKAINIMDFLLDEEQLEEDVIQQDKFIPIEKIKDPFEDLDDL